MKANISINTILIFISVNIIISSCSKEWLEAKPDKGLVVPETIKDYQAILDNAFIMNTYYSHAGNIFTDAFYIPDQNLGNLAEWERSIYQWSDQIVWENDISYDWSLPFTVIEHANIVIDGLKKISSDALGYKDLLGQAHFFRAFAYYNLAQIFCKQYVKSTSMTDLGLPIRLSSDVNILQPRSTLEELYQQILSDLSFANENLDLTGKYILRPSKVSTLAMMSKVFLTMQDYEKALVYADSSLSFKSDLIDFNNNNQVSTSFPFRFPVRGNGNPEIIFYVFSQSQLFALGYPGNVVQASQELYQLYDGDDLRKQFFFTIENGSPKFLGSYTGEYYAFDGLATNQILLIRAECNARLNKIQDAQDDINKLITYRYKTNTAPVISENNSEELLRLILLERRKELPNSGNVRWEDLRRLNLDPRFQVTLHRKINNIEYILPPNDSRYILSIPMNEIRLSGIKQNER